MKLRDYLFKEDIKLIDFAKSVGLSNSYISTIKDGKAFPSKVVRLAIEYLTNKKVNHDKDWRKKK